MKKTKAKGAVKSKPLQKVQVDSVPQTTKKNHAEVANQEANFIPFVRVENKRKRGPRRVKQKNPGVLGETQGDSASDLKDENTSVSHADEEEDVDQEHGNESRAGFLEGDTGNEAEMDLTERGPAAPARRGSLRLKVKPSKFRGESAVLATKPPAPQEKNNPVAQAPLHVSVKDGTKPVKPSEKHLKRSGESAEGPGSSKRQASELKTTVKDQSIASPAKTDRNFQLRQEQNRNELNAALLAVRKTMKMEAAEPFNSPVDPVALGIPDYFDVIKEPMDFGTICQNLDKGGKYGNAWDVYEDVQLVWRNCRKYNHKGDPILDLLKRVKKNFMKYWTTAGLHTEKTPASVDRVTTDLKAGQAKQHSDGLEIGSHHFGSNSSDQEEALHTSCNDLDSNTQKLQERKIISVYKAHGNKKKKQDHQESVPEEHASQAGRIMEGAEEEAGGRDDSGEKHVRAKPLQRKKDNELQSTPGKSRRVSGTGHHKSDCSCVVCEGVRRKLAREGKLGSSADAGRANAEGPSVLKFKSEANLSAARSTNEAGSEGKAVEEIKLKQISVEPMEIFVDRDMKGDSSMSMPEEVTDTIVHEELKNVTDGASAVSEEGPEEGPNTVSDEGADHLRDATETSPDAQAAVVQEQSEEEQIKNSTSEEKSEQVRDVIEGVTKDSTKDVAVEETKGGLTEELEDKEDAVQHDEHFVDTLDLENDRPEGGTRYYRASYEMPLRKINPAILGMGQRLFGNGSPWSQRHSLSRQSAKGWSENPIFTAVSALLSNKEGLMPR